MTIECAKCGKKPMEPGGCTNGHVWIGGFESEHDCASCHPSPHKSGEVGADVSIMGDWDENKDCRYTVVGQKFLDPLLAKVMKKHLTGEDMGLQKMHDPKFIYDDNWGLKWTYKRVSVLCFLWRKVFG